MREETRICHLCGATVGKSAFCAACTKAFERAPDPATMTGEERAAEMVRYAGPLEVPFGTLHQRIEQLVGRPVWTHEMASSNWERLVEEARTWDHDGEGPLQALDRMGLTGKTTIIAAGDEKK